MITMYQNDPSAEGIPPRPSIHQSLPENLTSVDTEGIQVKVEPTLTRVDSIEGGPRRISRREKAWQALQRAGVFIKSHKCEEWYAFKVGLAMLASSTAVLVGPIYDFFGVNSLWLLISVSSFEPSLFFPT